ncbi:arginine-hydroxylase NDUFAF5, mitochondrial-like isoform X5 [Diabrotica undecimpunctata]|uniref:arginine-hydroxylase NDUFAF5, mitochondrial-like isoform X5 n=1 Tax=Diabrotica undecimpunctata TaxID=50387 RepID=UPI003B6351C5
MEFHVEVKQEFPEYSEIHVESQVYTSTNNIGASNEPEDKLAIEVKAEIKEEFAQDDQGYIESQLITPLFLGDLKNEPDEDNSGCSRGYVSRHISPDSVEELILCDISESNLNAAVVQDGIKTTKQILDEEYIEFKPNSLDIVISCLSLHWVNDLPKAFKRILLSLKEDGVFLASVFGGDTLYELRSSLQLAELERRGGISPHISPFTEVRDIGSLLTRAGFTMLTIDTDEIIVRYPSMFELMIDLKGMAESNAALNRSLHLHRDTQFAAAALYQQLYGAADPESGEMSVPATFQIINMLGWKPHPKQPKPLERGTGEVSLKDLHRLDEIIKEVKSIKIDDDDKR